MIYELALRIFGAGIAGIIRFLPLSVDYQATEPSLTVAATLTAPVTREARRLVETGMSLRITYNWSLIVNNTRAYHASTVRELTWKNDIWSIDRTTHSPPFDSIQHHMGRAVARFPGFKFDVGDRLFLFVKATILPDSAFTVSTRMRTDVLWNCHIPTRQETFLFINGKFERE